MSPDDASRVSGDYSIVIRWLFGLVGNIDCSPKELLEAWQQAQKSDADSTPRKFLDQSKDAWLVYHLSKVAADQPAHFTGQSLLRRKHVRT